MLLGNVGLEITPGSGLWWLIRPVWLAVYLAALLPFALGFGRFERSPAADTIYPTGRLVVAALLICGGLGLLALGGVVGDGWLGLSVWVLLLPFTGAALAGINPLRRK